MDTTNHITLHCQIETSLRIDKFISNSLPEYSRGDIQKWIRQGAITCNNQMLTLASTKVRKGDKVSININVKEDVLLGENIPLHVVFEDDHILIINKPAGLVVHPAPGHTSGTLVHALIYHCGESLKLVGEMDRPGIVHRLDKDTTGLMIIAKSQKAYLDLVAQFKDKQNKNADLKRIYYALIYGIPTFSAATLENFIMRDPISRKKMRIVKEGGKKALMKVDLVKTYGQLFSLLQCTLYTGRTHQIRAQLAHWKYPIVGDSLYKAHSGYIKKSLKNSERHVESHIQSIKRQMLHARFLAFRHPITQEKMEFYSDIPEDFNDLSTILEKYI